MTEGSTPVSSAEVIWAYLAHEHRYKRAHATIAERFELGVVAYSSHLDGVADEMVAAVQTEVLARRCHQAVLQTVKLFRPLRWQLREASAGDLGSVWSVLPDGFPAEGEYHPGKQGPVSALLDGWLAYLSLENDQARQDAETHVKVLSELATQGLSHRLILRDEDADRTVVGDGRHRLFAAYRHAAAHSGFRMLVYWGSP